jgi:chromate transporter
MLDTTAASGTAPRHGVSFADALRVWARVALLSFGGPAGQIAVMHRILVEEKRWIGERRFLHALNYCMLLPGPEAQQLAVYIGWLMHGTLGGLAAGILFVLPGYVALMALSIVYATLGTVGLIQALFFGLKPAVLAVVLEAVVRIGRRALKNRLMVGIAALAFLAIFAFGVPFPVIVLGAGLVGWLGGRAGVAALLDAAGHGTGSAAQNDEASTILGETLPPHARPTLAWSLRMAAVLLVLWLGPVALMVAALGPDDVFSRIAGFFSALSVVTFGGAYAVLAWVAQAAVERFGWLAPGEMLDGLAMAETTPGPLIMVLLFVGFMAAFRDPSALSPIAAGVLGGTLATWVTFVPCFLWIFAGAPFAERLRENRALAAALAAITAAVVGVVLNLAVWFALHVLFGVVEEVRTLGMRLAVPELASIRPFSLLLMAGALLALFRWKLGMLPTLGAAAALGVAWHLAGGAL